MIGTLPCRIFAAFVFFAFAVPAAGDEQAAPPASTDAAVAEARALIDAGRFEEAIVVLRPLLGQEPVDGNVLFLYGLASLEASRRPGRADEDREILLDEAIAAFRAMLIEAPGLVRIRLELARAFFLKGEDTLARRHFEQVLAGKPPAEVVLNVTRFLAEIRARRRWSFHVGAALAPDTNIGAASDERTIVIGGLPFRRDAEDLTTSGIGVSVWGGSEYQYPLRDDMRLRAGAHASRREYSGSAFDHMSLLLHAGPRVLVSPNAEASVLASAGQRWLGSSPDSRDIGVRVETAGRFGPRVTAYAQGSWHDRRYRERTFLDGPVLDLSVGGAWVVAPIVRVDGAAGWAASAPRARAGGTGACGRAPASLWRCPTASRSAAAASCGGRTTRATGRPSSPRARRAPTARGACAPRCSTAPSPCAASAHSSRSCTRYATPTPSSTTTNAPAANSAAESQRSSR